MILIVILVTVLLLVSICATVLVRRLYIVVQPGFALVINGTRRTKVRTTSAIVLPVVQRAELIDISTKVMDIQRLDGEGLICLDNIRANAVVRFTLRVNPADEDILRVALATGCARAATPETLEALFTAKFTEALKIGCKRCTFADHVQNLERLKMDVLKIIGSDLNGYMLEDLAIAEFTQTPVDKLDPNNILDAQGIRRITEFTAKEAIRANELTRGNQKQLRAYAERNPEIVRQLAEYL